MVCELTNHVSHAWKRRKSLSAAVDQTAPKQAQSFHSATHNRADMLYCASFPQWEAGVFALLEQKCRSPPFLP